MTGIFTSANAGWSKITVSTADFFVALFRVFRISIVTSIDATSPLASVVWLGRATEQPQVVFTPEMWTVSR